MDLYAPKPLTGFNMRSRREPSLHPAEESVRPSSGVADCVLRSL